VLPNLIIIGAGRCGTTSLHRYLGLHPQIAMSAVKELDFFIEEGAWRRGVAWYEAQFPASNVRGEASPKYALYPLYRGVPERMSEIVPDAKLVYVVRDPIERALSSYRWARYVIRDEHRTLEEAIREPDMCVYLVAGRYATQLERYLGCFPKEQLLVLDHNDLKLRREETLARVFRFAGVDDAFTTCAFDEELNRGDAPAWGSLGRLGVRALDGVFGRHRSLRLRARTPAGVSRMLRTRPPPPTEIAPELQATFVETFREEADRLRRLTDEAFESWSV
jgi:hypothetical protein